MQKIIGKYSFNMNHLIGRGAYGCVYKGISVEGVPVAIKVIDRRMINQTNSQQLFNEIQSMKQLNHPNIVRFIDYFETQNNFYIISEYCNGGDLRAVIKQGKLHPKNVIKILQQILNGYQELYKQSIIHRDIKPANILLHQGTVKLADFGFAKKIDFENDLMTSIAGTPLYMAPQVILRQPYTAKCDIWSLGMILYELIFAKPPFQAENILQLQEMICKPIIITQINDPKLQKLIQGCLQANEEQRLSWDEIYAMQFEQQKYPRILVEVEPEQTDYRQLLISNYLQIEFEANQRIFINQLNFARCAFNFSFFAQSLDFSDLAKTLRVLAFYKINELEKPTFLKEYQKFQSHETGQYCINQQEMMKKIFLEKTPEIPSNILNVEELIRELENYYLQFVNKLNALQRNQLLFTFMIKQISNTLKNESFQFTDIYDLHQVSDQEIIQKILQ